MKLALLTHEPFYPPSGGGSAELLYLVKGLTQRDHEVHLFCPEFPNSKNVAKQFSIVIHPFKAWQMNRYTSFRSIKYLLYPIFLRMLVKKIANNIQFDIIFSQHAISSVAAGQLKSDLKIPVVMNFLDHLTGFMETWPKWRMPRCILKHLIQFELNLPTRYKADFIFTVSKELSKRFIENGVSPSRVTSINYGYDARLFKHRKPKPQLPTTIVMHGSFDTHHLGQIATKAIYSITQARPDVRFLFIGKETIELKNLIRKITNLSPKTNISCTGFINYELISEKLYQGHVGIIPYEESSGTHCAFVAKMVEYAAVGLPVVSTPLLGTKTFFLNEPTIIFSKFDSQTFARDTIEVLNKNYQRIEAKRLSERVANDLNWEFICEKVVNQLEEIHTC